MPLLIILLMLSDEVRERRIDFVGMKADETRERETFTESIELIQPSTEENRDVLSITPIEGINECSDPLVNDFL